MAHPAQVGLVQEDLRILRGCEHAGAEMERAVVGDAVFGFEALEKVTEELHRFGEIDCGAPDRADLVGFVRGGG